MPDPVTPPIQPYTAPIDRPIDRSIDRKWKFGIKDFIYIVSLLFVLATWYVDNRIQKNKYETLIENYEKGQTIVGEELDEISEFMKIQLLLNGKVIGHIENEQIHQNN